VYFVPPWFRSCHGEPLDLDDWNSFLQEQMMLNVLVNRIELLWDDEESSSQEASLEP